jgi:hypothetical protein
MSVIIAKPLGGCGSSTPTDNYTFLYDENPIGAVEPSAQGANSVAIGSDALVTAQGTNAIAVGPQSVARLPGSVNHANGSFQARGDAQTGKYLLRGITTNSSPTELFIDGLSQQLTVPDASTWTFKAMVTGHRVDVRDGHAGYTLEGVVYRDIGANTIAIQGKVSKSVIAESNRSWDINIGVDANTGALSVMAEGQTGKTIRWVASIETVEVMG